MYMSSLLLLFLPFFFAQFFKKSISCTVVSDSLRAYGLCNFPGSFIHGILQARILKWVAIPFSRGSSCHKDQTRSLALQADSSPSEPPGKPKWN